MIRLAFVALAVASCLAGWRAIARAREEARPPREGFGWTSPPLSASLRLVQAAGGRAQSLLAMADRPEREEQGFSPLPNGGGIWLYTPLPGYSGPLGDTGQHTVLYQWRGCSHRFWDYLTTFYGTELMSERELYLRPPGAGEGEPGIESVKLMHLSPAMVSATGGEPFEILEQRKAQGEKTVSLDEARRLARAWGCYPVPSNTDAARMSEPDPEVVAALLGRFFSVSPAERDAAHAAAMARKPLPWQYPKDCEPASIADLADFETIRQEIHDVSETEVRELLAATNRRSREREGFLPYASTGAVRITPWPMPPLTPAAEPTRIRLQQDLGCFYRRVEVEIAGGRRRVRYEHQRYRGVLLAGQIWGGEHVDVRFGALDRDELPLGPEPPGAWYRGPIEEPVRIPPELALRLGRAWRCLPTDAANATVVQRAECPVSGEQMKSSLAAARLVFSDDDLFGWASEEGWRFALIAARSWDGLSPRVLAMGAPLETVLSALENPRLGSQVRWIPLSLDGDSPEPVPDSLVESLASTLRARGRTLETAKRPAAVGG